MPILPEEKAELNENLCREWFRDRASLLDSSQVSAAIDAASDAIDKAVIEITRNLSVEFKTRMSAKEILELLASVIERRARGG